MTGISRVAIIAAVARNGVIGHRTRIPWHLPEDLRRFRQLTLGHAVIMGRRTFESIGKPLAGRNNIVVPRSPDWTRAGCHAAHSLEAALAAVHEREDAFVIGGAEIYPLALPVARRLYMTEIELDFEGDAFFPEFDRSRWGEGSLESRVVGGADGSSYHFCATNQRHGR